MKRNAASPTPTPTSPVTTIPTTACTSSIARASRATGESGPRAGPRPAPPMAHSPTGCYAATSEARPRRAGSTGRAGRRTRLRLAVRAGAGNRGEGAGRGKVNARPAMTNGVERDVRAAIGRALVVDRARRGRHHRLREWLHLVPATADEEHAGHEAEAEPPRH